MTAKPASNLPEDPRGWLAKLALRYEKRAARSVIAARQHQGPLTVQKPFYPEGDVCHTYILHPPGGVVGGDILKVNIEVSSGAHALLTTPASAKFYRSTNKLAEQHNRLRVEGNGILEWLPQETILFADSKVKTVTRVELDSAAKFCGWEIVCLGRPASHEQYDLGYCQQIFQLYREQQPLLIDRTVIDGQSEMLQAKWGLSGHTVLGVMAITPADKVMLSTARAAIDDFNGLCALTLIDDVLVCRYLGYHGMQARETLTKVWQAVRPLWCGRDAHPPRIWST